MSNNDVLQKGSGRMASDIFDEMAIKHGAPAVARLEAPRFAGGGVTVKLLANHDAMGTGPKGRFYIGRKVMYPTCELAAWLRQRSRPAA
jgi:hypothetical protein